MDFGLVGIEGFLSSEQQQPKNGSGPIKQERSDPNPSPSPNRSPFDDESNRASKMAKRVVVVDDDLGLRSNDNSNNQPKQQMLSFCSSTNSNNNNNNKQSEVSFLTAKDVGLSTYYQQQSSYSRTPSGNMNGGMHGSFTGIRGPFTPAQWIELEHQAMIYKYFTSNVPVPANLLIPIRKALTSSGFPGFSVGSYPAHPYGWGSFHLGFSSSTDPEPGRCRRTDGKKWRCSRDAVPDQKYCERHINRGRHRSRKPVEGQTGQAASGPSSTKMMMSSSMSSSLVASSGGASNSIVTIAQHQIKGLQPADATNASTEPTVNRIHDQQGLSVMPPSINLKPKDSPFSISKQHNSFDESSQSEFGLVSTDSLLNPSQKSSYLGCKGYNSLLEFSSAQQTQDQYPLRHFMDDWPKDQTSRSSVPWSEELKSDWTQLSMSMPNQEKVTPSLRLTRELDSVQIGLSATKQNSWIPITWGNSMGGPLGEVLNNASNNNSNPNMVGHCKGTSPALNLKGEGWDGTGSPQLGSSPTGVLQKSTFVSLSNSSSGGSPRGENKKTQEGATTLCDDLLISAAHAT